MTPSPHADVPDAGMPDAVVPDPAWLRVRRCLDEVWFLEAPDESLRVDRLIERHRHFGKSPDDAAAHVFATDERNAALVAGHRDSADIVLRRASW